jgi:NAD+ kinase
MGKIFLYAKRDKRALNYTRYLAEELRKRGYIPVGIQEELDFLEKAENIKDCELCIVLGGDGTFLAAARLVLPYEIPIVGINLGTFGFLTEIETVEVKKLLPKILKKKLPIQERLALEVYIEHEDGKREFVSYAVNDAVISKAALARIINISIETPLGKVGNISGDGIIVATPTGSTAYALAAGGPIVYPTLDAKVLVPICPHTLTQRPIVVDGNLPLNLALETDYSTVYLTVDGQIGRTLKPSERVFIEKSQHKLKMMLHPYRSYFDLLRIKLKWGRR